VTRSPDEARQLLFELRSLKRNVSFAMIPYLVDEMPLTVYAKAVYLHIVRRTGASEGGVCFETAQHMAEHLAISRGSVNAAKQELSEAGLIKIKKKRAHGEYAKDIITLEDIELPNAYFFSNDHMSSDFRRQNSKKFGKNLLKALLSHLEKIISELEQNVCE
jgi:hypothetical protein